MSKVFGCWAIALTLLLFAAGCSSVSNEIFGVCCPPDPQPTSCMHLGGAAFEGMCGETCDFFGATNWRIEKDARGCPVWRYDYDDAGLRGGKI